MPAAGLAIVQTGQSESARRDARRTAMIACGYIGLDQRSAWRSSKHGMDYSKEKTSPVTHGKGGALGALLSMLGQPGPGPTTTVRESTRSTVRRHAQRGGTQAARRSAAVLFDNGGVIVTLLRPTLLRNVAQDSAALERVVMASGMDWTITRPPRLTMARSQIAVGRMPRGEWIVSRADLAHFLLGELQQGARTHKIVGMAH